MENSLESKNGEFYITVEFLFSWQGKERYGVTCHSKHHDLIVDRIVKKRDIKSAARKCQMDLLAAELDAEGDSPVFIQAWDQIKLKMMGLSEMSALDASSKMLPTTYGNPN